MGSNITRASAASNAQRKAIVTSEVFDEDEVLATLPGLSGFTIESQASYMLRACFWVTDTAAAGITLRASCTQTPYLSKILTRLRANTPAAFGGVLYGSCNTDLNATTAVVNASAVVLWDGLIVGHNTTDATLSILGAQYMAQIGATTFHAGSWVELIKVT